MSQAVGEAVSSRMPANEFDYRPVPVLAPVSLVMGLCAAMALLTAFGIVIAFIGLLLSAICYLRIRRAQETLGGGWLAKIGLVLSTLFLLSGMSLQSYNYATEVPEGYTRVNFPEDISRKQFVIEYGRRKLHPDVKPLVNKNIFIKGYMRASRKETGLTAFQFLKDNGKCCFGGDPKPWDMILVTLPPGESVDLMTGLVSVAGPLTADVNAAYGMPVYRIEATRVERARSAF